MKATEIHEASTLARAVSNSLNIAVAMADGGHQADAQYRVNIAHAAFMSLAASGAEPFRRTLFHIKLLHLLPHVP